MATARKNALKKEADSQPVEFTFDGEDYVIPAPKLWPLEVVEAQEAGKYATCIRALLGEEQNARFRSKPRTMSDLEELTEVLFEAVNADLGESDD